MRITKKNPNQLIIVLPQYIFRLIGVFFILIGGGIWLMFLQSYELNCTCKPNQAINTCVLTTKHPVFSPRTTHFINLKQAQLIEKTNSEGDRNYNIELISASGRTKLSLSDTPSYSLASYNERLINAYLQTCPNQSLAIGSLSPWWLKLFVLAFPLTGLLMMALTSTIILDFNKNLNSLTISRKNLFSESQDRYDLDEIEHIIIQESQGNKNQTMYRVALVMKNNQTTPLTTAYDSLLAPKITLAKTINNFLGLNSNLSEWTSSGTTRIRLNTIVAVVITIAILVLFMLFFF